MTCAIYSNKWEFTFTSLLWLLFVDVDVVVVVVVFFLKKIILFYFILILILFYFNFF